ncbi:MAG: hypothetical protein OEQ74_07655 [Gammaproteobacteria bacterium]|nr:hypothetical protein [Gammaproteobacteria bacterium]
MRHKMRDLFAGLLVTGCLITPPVAWSSEPDTACGLEVVENALLDTAGLVIGEIILDRQPIFDTSNPEENKRLHRLANRYHVSTRPSTIRSQLLFEPGDAYSRQLIEESERILRRRAYIFEPSIHPVRHADGVVDVCVTIHEVWTLLPGFSLERSGGENEFSIDLEDRNIGGTGAALELRYESDVERDSYRISFGDPQIGRSRVALSTFYENNSDGGSSFLAIERPFFALDTRWSGGVRVFDDDRVRPLYDLGNSVVEFRQEQRYLQVSGGWSRGLRDGWVRRWTTGAVFDEDKFAQPADSLLTGPVPADRKFVYPFLGFELLQNRFVETQNQDQIGRTEDLYLGTRLTASLGWSATGLGASREALLFNTAWRNAVGLPESTLWLFDAGLSGRRERGKARNTVLRTRARFYRRQSEKRSFYVALAVDAGERLDLDNPLRLGGNSGLRGYPLAYQNGEHRALFTIEQRYFTDWYPLRLFRVGGAIFADVGRTWGRSPVGSGSLGWLKDVGFGLRLGPTRSSASRVLHVDIAFPLDGEDSIDDVQLLIEGRRSF